MLGKGDIGREKAVEERGSAAAKDAGAASVYAANRDVSIAAGMIAAAANPHNESHLAGGAKEHGKSSNAIGDDVLDAAAKGKSGMDGYEAGMVAAQGVESQYLNPTMQNDAFKEEQSATIQHDTKGREAVRSMPAQDIGGPTPADAAALGTDGLSLATAHSAQNLTFGKDAPKQEQVPGGLDAKTQNTFAAIMEKSGLRDSFASIAASGATMGGKQSLFGDSKGQLAVPSTPGHEKPASQKASASMSA